MTLHRADPVERGLMRAVRAHVADARLVATWREPWASVTFAGARYRLAIDAADAAAVDRFLLVAAEVDISLSTYVVADLLAVAEPDGAGGARLTLEALVLDEA